MEKVGWAATVIAGIVVLGGLALGVRALPDLKRYLQMRRM
ncbi:MAG: DUF6893 family small protein [Mycobacterium sp.]|jgi:hypothetical protein